MRIYNSSIKMNNIDFLNFLRTIDTNISIRDCEYIFNSIDTDKNGTIDLEEFEKALEALNLDKVLKRKEDILEQEKFKKKSLDMKKEKNESLSKEAKIYIKYNFTTFFLIFRFLSDMINSQNLNYAELIKNFDSRNKFILNWDDFKKMMQLVVEKNEIKVIKEIWDIFKNKSSAEMEIKDIKRMIQTE